MSVFNYKTRKDPLESLRDQVARISKCLKALRIWEVNDVTQGPNILKRRRVTPSPQMGVVGRGPWNEVTGLNFEEGGGGGESFDWTICALGYKCDPVGDDHDLVRIYAGEINRIAVAQTDLTVANNNYVYVRRTIADNTMVVLVGASVPANDATYLYYRLYRFTVTNGIATVQTIYRPFDIEAGGEDELPVGGTDGQLLQRDASLNAVWGWGRMKTI